MPNAAKERLKAVAELPLDFIHPKLRAFYDRGVTGPENASTKHPFFKALARHPATVPFHSIIATHRARDPRNASDGIVPYSSARLDGAASETLVPYLHTCLEKPKTVQAVMKILKEAK